MISRFVLVFHPDATVASGLAEAIDPNVATVHQVNDVISLLREMRRFDPDVVLLPWRFGESGAERKFDLATEQTPDCNLIALVSADDAGKCPERPNIVGEILLDGEPRQCDPEQVRSVVAAALAACSSVGTVLIVEDSQVNRDLVADVLHSHHFRALRAVNAEEGLEIARDAHPDVTLMDIYLPGISGIEAVRKLKADAATEPIPIVMLSANGTDAAIAEALEAGAIDFVVKPFSPRSLLEKVTFVLEKRGLLAHA